MVGNDQFTPTSVQNNSTTFHEAGTKSTRHVPVYEHYDSLVSQAASATLTVAEAEVGLRLAAVPVRGGSRLVEMLHVPKARVQARAVR
jgi:hypothetical protein